MKAKGFVGEADGRPRHFVSLDRSDDGFWLGLCGYTFKRDVHAVLRGEEQSPRDGWTLSRDLDAVTCSACRALLASEPAR